MRGARRDELELELSFNAPLLGSGAAVVSVSMRVYMDGLVGGQLVMWLAHGNIA
jgi:hypothetical protein